MRCRWSPKRSGNCRTRRLRSTSTAGWRIGCAGSTNARASPLSWAALKGQFGQEYADTKNFKRKFLGAVKKATSAYKEARIETVPGGLKLLPSPPPVKRAAVALPRHTDDAAQPKRISVRRRLAHWPVKDLVPLSALEMVPSIAPGWDKYFLEAQYRAWVATLNEPPRHPERAFLGLGEEIHQGPAPMNGKCGHAQIRISASARMHDMRKCMHAHLRIIAHAQTRKCRNEQVPASCKSSISADPQSQHLRRSADDASP